MTEKEKAAEKSLDTAALHYEGDVYFEKVPCGCVRCAYKAGHRAGDKSGYARAMVIAKMMETAANNEYTLRLVAEARVKELEGRDKHSKKKVSK